MVAGVVVVEDNAKTMVSHIYFEDEPGRRQQTKRVTKAEAIAIAQTIARALTDEVESGVPAAGG